MKMIPTLAVIDGR